MKIHEEHLRHMHKRYTHTLGKLNELMKEKASRAERALSTVETAAGAWLGGLAEGRTDGGTVMNVPINLGAGILLAAAGYFDVAGDYSQHLNNVGDGFLASYLSAKGFAFGQHWKATGKLFGGAPALSAPAVKGDLSEADMANIVARMQAAAHG